ncbi:MAG: hypothetical protein ABFR47_06900 [Verrucomicrobiota bacterium]
MTGTNYMILIAGAALAAGMACAEERPEYKPERYDVIIERSPFGVEPLVETEDPQKKAAAAAAAAAKELRLCFLLESETGEIRAGFENLKAKKGDSRSIILMVGESFMGMKLLDIDLDTSQATLESKGQSVVFDLTKGAAPAKRPAKKAPTKQPQRRFGGGFRRKEPPKKPTPPPAPKLSPEEQERRRAEVRANLQDYQMEVIRQGMPPLPIPLTPEMDDQLVAEGVLPPTEGQEDLLPE